MALISTCPSYWLRDTVPSGLPDANSVIFYHPLNDLADNTTGSGWINNNMVFVDGVIVSGICGSGLDDYILSSGAISSGINNPTCLSTVFWSSGFYGVQAGGVSGWMGLSDISGNEQNGILFSNNEIRLLVSGQTEAIWNSGMTIFGEAIEFPLPSGQGELNDWHFTAITIGQISESGVSGCWHCSISYDGGDVWPLYPGVYSGSMAPSGWPTISTNLYPHIYIHPTIEGSGFCPAIDEASLWGDVSFPSGVLYDIYNLGTLYDRPMNEYWCQYGIPNRPLLLSTIGGHQAMSTMWHSGNWNKRIR